MSMQTTSQVSACTAVTNSRTSRAFLVATLQLLLSLRKHAAHMADYCITTGVERTSTTCKSDSWYSRDPSAMHNTHLGPPAHTCQSASNLGERSEWKTIRL